MLVVKPEDVDKELDVVDVSDTTVLLKLLDEVVEVDEGPAPVEVLDVVGSASSPHTNVMSPNCHCSSPFP